METAGTTSSVAMVVAPAKGGSSGSVDRWSVFRHVDPSLRSKISMFFMFGSLKEIRVLFTTIDDQVYAFGKNSCGSLGIGDVARADEPVRIPELCGQRVVRFTSGISNARGAYGGDYPDYEYDSDDSADSSELDDDYIEGVSSTSKPASYNQVLALTSAGQVYTWGSNNSLSVHAKGHRNTRPVLVKGELIGKQCIDIACSADHALALVNDGSVYAWGCNQHGQLGIGNTSGQASPVTVVWPDLQSGKVVSVSCSKNASFAVADSGEVFTWGSKEHGQLGMGVLEPSTKYHKPCRLSASRAIVKVEAGYSHCLALTDAGVVYGWGNNRLGQLGNRDRYNQYLKADQCRNIMRKIGKAVDIMVQGDTSAAMCENGAVYVWGRCGHRAATLLTPLTTLHEAMICYTGSAPHPVMTVSASSTLSESMRKAFDDRETSDLTITVGGKAIHVHKTILQIRCEHFRTMFQGEWREKSQSAIEIDGYSYDVYRAFLRFLYTDELDLPARELVELFDLANCYFENDLKRRCAVLIAKKLTADSVVGLYKEAMKSRQHEVAEILLTYAANHAKEVAQSDALAALNDAQLMKTLVIEMSKLKTNFQLSESGEKVEMKQGEEKVNAEEKLKNAEEKSAGYLMMRATHYRHYSQ